MKSVLSVLFVAISLIGFSQEAEGPKLIENVNHERSVIQEEAAINSENEQHIGKTVEREQLAAQEPTKKRSQFKLREVVKKVRQLKNEQKKNSNSSDAMIILLIILAIILPWLAVGIHTGWDALLTLISVLLWLLFWLPGIIFALLVIFDVI